MPAKHAKREELVARIAERLLLVGAAQIPLRDLAAELGTSDRMLLYYFRDKSDLVEASLEVVATRLSLMIEAAIPDVRMSPAGLLVILLDLLRSAPCTPAMNVWADLVARSSRGEQPFHRIAGQTAKRWLDWLDRRLAIEDAVERQGAAAAILTVLEGARQLETSVPGSTRQVGAILSRAFSNI